MMIYTGSTELAQGRAGRAGQKEEEGKYRSVRCDGLAMGLPR